MQWQGFHLRAVRQALTKLRRNALFMDYLSCPQKDANDHRSETEDKVFKKCLGSMGSLYASPRTLVSLQLKAATHAVASLTRSLSLLTLVSLGSLLSPAGPTVHYVCDRSCSTRSSRRASLSICQHTKSPAGATSSRASLGYA